MYTIGFDIGGTKTSTVIGNSDGCFEGFSSLPTPTCRDELLKMLREAVVSHQKRHECAAVGIGIAGARRKNGELWTPNIPAADGSRLADLLSDMVGLPVYVENDAHAALTGERWLGSLKDADNAILLSVGTGIGSAIVLDGRILRGEHNVAGSVGWLCMRESGDDMLHYEELAAGSSLSAMAAQAGIRDGRELTALARAGYREAADILHRWTKLLAAGIASLASAFDLDTVALAGGVSEEFDLYGEGLIEYARRYASPTNSSLTIRRSALGSLACVYGAVRLAAEKYEMLK